MCLICGVDNVLGMQMRFFETEDGSLVGRFTDARNIKATPGVCTAA